MIYLYGASDDLVEIEGDLREEFSPSESELDDGYYVAFSNGLVVKIKYDGDWVLRPIFNQTSCHLYPAGSPNAIAYSGKDYSDVIEIHTDDVTWAVGGTDLVTHA